MRDSSRDVVKARCETIGTVLRFLFWAYAVFVAALLALGIWMAIQPADQFSIYLADTGNGIAGYGYWLGGLEVDFLRDSLTESAVNSPKWVYLSGFLTGFLRRVLTLAILWNIRNIFKMIDAGGTPFLQMNSRAVFQAGVLMIADGVIECGVLPMLWSVLGVCGRVNLGDLYWWKCLLAGGIVICLSYIFEYGTVLQRESDETL